MSVSSRRRPYPYDMEIDDFGVMLMPTDEGGDLVAKKIQSLASVTPTDYSYSSYPPYKERTYRFGRLTMGAGERTQGTAIGQGYHYAINADCSVGGYMMLGPLPHKVEPRTTGEIRAFAVGQVDGTPRDFALAGRYVLVRDTAGEDWTVSRDLGEGVTGTSAVRFTDAAGTDALYVATSDGELWQFDGSSETISWVRCRLTAGGPTDKAGFLEVLGHELWYGAGNAISKCETDPTTAANWSGWITVGDATHDITALRQFNNQLLVFKSNGVYSLYTVGTDVQDIDLFPHLREQVSETNGRGAVAWVNGVYAPYGATFYRVALGETATLVPVGPERLQEIEAEIMGEVVACCGHAAWFLYFVTFNRASGNSYLWKLGTWLNPEGSRESWQFLGADGHPPVHGALVKWAGRRVTALGITSQEQVLGTVDVLGSFDVDGLGPYTVDDLANIGLNPLLLVGFQDGTIDYIVLPKNSPNPLTDGACEFTTTGRVYWPLHHGLFQADTKAWYGLSVYGPHLAATGYATHEYRTGATDYAEMGTNFTANGQRVEFPEGTYGRQMELATVLRGGGNATPVLEGCGLHEAVRPALRLEYSFAVRAEPHLALRNGAVSRRTAEAIREKVRWAANYPGTVRVRLPDETLEAQSFTEYGEMLLPRFKRYGLAWLLPCQAVQWQTYTIYGTVDRLGAYTVDGLGGYTVDDLAWV